MAGAARARRRPSPRNFYRQALTEAEQVELNHAQDIEGLDDEIALLRVRLKHAVEERPEDLQLLVRGMDLLVKAVAARYRLSPQGAARPGRQPGGHPQQPGRPAPAADLNECYGGPANMSAPRASRHPFPTPVASPSETTPLTLGEQMFYSLTMPTALHRAISRFRPTRRPAGRDGATAARCSAAAFRRGAAERGCRSWSETWAT